MNSNVLFFLFIFLAISCKKENQLPDPLEAGWKGKPVCEVIEETDKFKSAKVYF